MANTNYKSSYAEKLKDPRWLQLRAQILHRDNNKCQLCENYDTLKLNVHHKYYDANKQPWEYPITALITLCEVCHEDEDGFREIVFKNLPVAMQDKAKNILRNGKTNRALYFICADKIPFREGNVIGNFIKNMDLDAILRTPENDRWNYIKL